MKSVFLLCLSIFLTGCVNAAPYTRKIETLPTSVIYAYRVDDHMCYRRYLQQRPIDQICVDGDNMRYSAIPDTSHDKFLPMPQQAQALFNSIAVARVLRHQQSFGRGNSDNRAIDGVDAAAQREGRDLLVVSQERYTVPRH